MKQTLTRLAVMLLTLIMVISCTACGQSGTEDLGSVVEIVEEVVEEDDGTVESTGSSDKKDDSSKKEDSSKDTQSGNKTQPDKTTSSKDTSSKKSDKKNDKLSGTLNQNEYDVVVDTQNVAGDTKAQLALQAKLKDSAKGKTITLLSSWGTDGIENQCYMQMFNAMCGGTLEIIRCADYSGMQQKLASLHASGDAPDLYQITNQDFPSLMYRNIVTPLSDSIDFSSELYSDRDRQLLSQLAWNGKIYFWPTMHSVVGGRSGIWWNRSIFEQAGVSDSEMPDALYKANKWTWDALYNLEKRVTNADKGIMGLGGEDGTSFSYQMVLTTGEDFIKVTKNGIASNFTSPNVTRAMNMFKKIANPTYYLRSEEAGQVFMRGKLAMKIGGPSMINNSKIAAMAKDGIADIVPIPRDPKQKNYNVYGSIGGYAVPTGSKNKELAINFIKMLRASDYYEKQLSDIITKDYNASCKKYESDWVNKFNVIPCLSLGIKEIHSLTWSSTGNSFVQGSDTWENVAAKVSPQVQSVLDKLG